MKPAGTVPGRDAHVDALRGAAILMVLLLHAGALTPGLENHKHLATLFGRFGVGMQLFFVLSGYLIARSWAALRDQPHALAIYALRRAGKIVPLYMVALHLNIAMHLWLSHADPSYAPLRNSVSADTLTPLNYLAHLLFLQGLIPAWQHTLVDGSWSIVAEVYFYVLFPLGIARHCSEPRRVFHLWLASLVLAVFVAFLTRKTEASYGYYNFINQLPCFLLGVLVHSLHRTPAITLAMPTWAPGLAALCAIFGMGMMNGMTSPLGIHHVYAILFGALLLALPHWPAGVAWAGRRSLLRFMGRTSYALFFTHLVLLKLQYHLLVDRAGMQDFRTLLALNLLTSVVGSLLVGGLLLDRLDRHFVSLARLRAQRLGTSPTTLGT